MFKYVLNVIINFNFGEKYDVYQFNLILYTTRVNIIYWNLNEMSCFAFFNWMMYGKGILFVTTFYEAT